MHIKTQDTPNPDTLKFILDHALIDSEVPYDFISLETAHISPLAQDLFEIEGVDSLMIGENFIAVTRKEVIEWDVLSPLITEVIMKYILSGQPVITDLKPSETIDSAPDYESLYDSDTLSIVKQIVELIDTRVRPAVSADGGDIIFNRFEPETGIVFLQLRGACSGCPSSLYTLKHGIERLLQHFIPEVSGVEAIE